MDKSAWDAKITLSSANITILQSGNISGKSFINRRNKLSPRTDP